MKLPFLILCYFFLTSPLLSQSWQYTVDQAAIFSSPKATDLNNDQYPDIIIGTGNEDAIGNEGVLALDGKTGQKLWSYQSDNQIFGSAVFEDVNNDGVPEVFVGGRKALFYCLDGRNGNLIWQFDPSPFGHRFGDESFNLYSPAFVEDQDGDGVRDLVNVYGGGSKPIGNYRPPGWLVLISGKTGALIARDSMPDSRESYSSPLVHDFDGDGEPEILFGSGEERRGGHLYRCDLDELRNGDISQAEVLITDSLKGVIAVSSLADFNADGTLDIACPVLNEKLVVLDGKNGQTIFEYRKTDHEHYVTPVIGNFIGDATPDILCCFQKGIWPFYSNYTFTLIDGETQTAVWDSVFNYYQLTQYVALDTDSDGYDEFLFCQNTDTGFFQIKFTHQVKVVDFQDDSIFNILPIAAGLNLFSSPLMSDFDQDGKVEITYAHGLDQRQYYTVDSSRIVHRELALTAPQSIAWGSYLGNDGDGIFSRRFLVPAGLGRSREEAVGIIYPNPTTGNFSIKQNEAWHSWRVTDIHGKLVAQGSGPKIRLTLPAGMYSIVLLGDKKSWSQRFMVVD